MSQHQETITRRAALRHGAALIALTPVAAFGVAAMVEPIEASGASDPIFRAIEIHRAAYEAFEATLKAMSRLEEALPADHRRSGYDHDAEAVVFVESDDPRWIAIERAVAADSEAENEASSAFVKTEPATLEGVIAALSYAHEFDGGGARCFGDYLDDGEEGEAEWHYLFHQTLARAVARIVAEGRVS